MLPVLNLKKSKEIGMKKLEDLLVKFGIDCQASSIDWSNLQGENRPTCGVPGCNKPAANYRTDRSTGYKKWRRSQWIAEQHPDAEDIWCCTSCHNQNTARRHGVPSAKHLTAKRQGLTVSQLSHRSHPYLWYREETPYCENQDGRLGFVCNTELPTQEMLNAAGLPDWRPYQFLEVDHKNGNHTDNRRENFQTLCKHCHVIKTYTNGDTKTPGRKTRKTVDAVLE